MVGYTYQEQLNILRAYFVAKENTCAAQRLYRDWFPNLRTPDQRTFSRAVQRLRDHGSFNRYTADLGPQKSQRILKAEQAILDIIDKEGTISSRKLANRTGISAPTASKILQEQQSYSYHITKVQVLEPGDPMQRRYFCEWLMDQITSQPNFLNYVLWTDVATFTCDGVWTGQNTCIWANQHRHIMDETENQFTINVWAGIIHNNLIGPYFLPSKLNADIYLRFLNETLYELLEDVPLIIMQNMWFVHDGTPAHSTTPVANFLNKNFGKRWIGYCGTVKGPPRSPDLNPCDFFLWGHMQQLVYKSEISAQGELRKHIENAATTIKQNPNIFTRIKESMRRRISLCIEQEGRYLENFL